MSASSQIQGWNDSMKNEAPEVYVGIDVAKDSLVVGVLPRGHSETVANESKSLKKLVAKLKKLQPARIALEATGGLEQPLVNALRKAGLAMLVANPQRVRQFARSMGAGAKTDRLDALLLARYASVAPERPVYLRSESEQELRALSTRRRQLVEQMAEEKTRLQQTGSATVAQSLGRHIRMLEKEIKKLDEQIKAQAGQDPAVQDRLRRLCTVKGIGPVLAVTLVTELPELGMGRSADIVSLAGLAPVADDSGQRHGPRHIRGGRRPVRTALYMAALSLFRYDNCLRAFYRRLVDRGKLNRVAQVAVMRKLLLALHAMLRDQRDWDPHAALAAA